MAHSTDIKTLCKGGPHDQKSASEWVKNFVTTRVMKYNVLAIIYRNRKELGM
jgi:hypothetical protein